MGKPDDESLNREETDRFAGLPREIAPRRALEDRVAAAVRRDRGAMRRSMPRWLTIAAGAALFAAGFAFAHAASVLRPSPPAMAGRYLLLLYDAANAPAGASENAARVAEYSAWSARERRAGVVESGEQLDDTARALGPGLLAGAQPAGLFIIRAATLEDAMAAGMRCPHLRHGGSIVVRPLSQ